MLQNSLSSDTQGLGDVVFKSWTTSAHLFKKAVITHVASAPEVKHNYLMHFHIKTTMENCAVECKNIRWRVVKYKKGLFFLKLDFF